MAEPFDTIGASFADVIDRLVKGEITEAQAATALAPLLAATNDGEFGARIAEIIGVMGRVTGTLIVEGPPSNLLGAPGSNAWDRVNKVFYGPKDAVTGWPPGDSMTEGPAGPELQLQVTATHIQWRVEGAAAWSNLIALSALEGADGQQVSLQKSATHVQWRLGAGAWVDLIPLADLKGNTGLTPDITVTAVTGAAGSDVVVNKTGTSEAPTFALTIPRGAIGLTPNLTAQIAMVAHGEPAVVTRSGPDSAPVLTFSIPSPLNGEDGSEIELQASETHIQWRRLGDTGWTDLLAIADLKVKGDKGDAFTFDAQPADLAGRAAFDNEGPDFTVLVMDTGMVYSRVGLTPGVWSDGFPFGQTQNDILVALSELNTSTGVLVQTGPSTFAKRAIGAAADGNILDRLSADGRYRRQGVNVPQAEVEGLTTALGDKADAAAVLTALGGKQASLGFTPEDAAKKGAANGYAGLDAGGKVPAAQLPDPPTVPVKATGAELRTGTDDAKFGTAKGMADAAAVVTITPTTAAAGMDFSGFINAEITLTANLTVGAPSGGFARKTGEIDIVQDATGGRTLAFHANYIVPANFALQATANGRTSIPYRYQADGKVRLYNPSKWVA